MVVGVLGIADGIEKVVEARDAAAIFGRTASRAVDQARIRGIGLGGQALLDPDRVVPAVAKVVEIGEALDGARGEVAYPQVAAAARARAELAKADHLGLDKRLAAE